MNNCFSIITQGRVVRKQVNVNPGLNITEALRFLFKNVFTSNFWCSLRSLQLKTEGLNNINELPNQKLQN